MAPLRFEVNGQSTIYHPAERAVVSISVRSEGASQDEVARDVATASSQVRDLLKSLSGKDDKGLVLPNTAITHWSNSSLSTGSYFSYNTSSSLKGKKTRIYNASMSFEAKFQDFARLGSVATSLSTLKHVNIDNIEWRLTDKTKSSLTSQCRHQAIHDAIAKAKDYAAALDKPIPPVVEIRDSGDGNTVYAVQSMRYERHSKSAASPDIDLNFSPEDVSLQSSVFVVLESKGPTE